MKKILFILSVLVMGLVLVSCGNKANEEAAQANLDSAYASLPALFQDPNNIISSFNVNTSLKSGTVTAEWSSSDTDVISFGTPTNGIAVATVTRPAFGEDDAEVTLTASLSAAVEDSDKVLEKEWTIDVVVKANTVEEITIESVADIQAITDLSYADGTYSVTLTDMTILSDTGTILAYDGTGIIQLYGGDASKVEKGKVYTLTGLIDWYNGVFELADSVATEQTSATPQYPTKAEEDSVADYIEALIADGYSGYTDTTPADGNFAPIYASITGVVYVSSTDKYGTFIVDQTFDPATGNAPSADDTEADGFLVYYGSANFEDLKAYDGKEVTIDVVIYSYRNDKDAFTLVYVGGDNGIVSNLNDADKVAIDSQLLSVPVAIEENTDLALPTTGANGTTIAWASSNTDVITNAGVVTVPESAVDVTLTATVSIGTETPVVVEFVVTVGALPTVTMASMLELADGAMAYTEVEVLFIGSYYAVVGDTSGYGYVYEPEFDSSVEVGSFIGMKFTVNNSYGLYRMRYITVVEAEGTDPNLTPTATTWTGADAVAFTELDKWSPQYVTMDIVGYASGDYTNGYVLGFAPFTVRLYGDGVSAALRDTEFTATGWITARNTSTKYITLDGETYGTGTALTDAQKVAYATDWLDVPAADAEVTADLDLPTAGMYGTTVAWVSSNTAVIANDGTVTRPANGAGDVTLTLTYTVSSNGVDGTPVVISVKVLEESLAPEPVTATIDSAGSYSSNLADGAIDTSLYTVTPTGILAMEFYANNTTTKSIFNNSSGQIRLYRDGDNAGDGGELIINATTGYVITSISVYTDSNAGLSIDGAAASTEATVTASVSNAVSVSIQNVSTSTIQIAYIEVTYVAVS